MTLALFLGAGNIIFPPLVGMQAGANSVTAGAGFIITAVLFPALAIISLAINKGDINELTRPLGRAVSIVFISVCFLTLGVLFGTPRTATISYEAITNGAQSTLTQKRSSLLRSSHWQARCWQNRVNCWKLSAFSLSGKNWRTDFHWRHGLDLPYWRTDLRGRCL
ncbi:branched-chain amino acid transport system II carrier protein [Pseudocitrobacter faecalis]|nr:branched-chain amino acid transport system II carrier protein [Pseudocitrobacter faecalis]